MSLDDPSEQKMMNSLKEIIILLENNKNDVDLTNKSDATVIRLIEEMETIPEDGWDWLNKEADAGNSHAQNVIALIVTYGDCGRSIDKALAFYWLKRSADAGNLFAQINLADMYWLPEYKNFQEGLRLTQLTAEKGLLSAMHNMGTIYCLEQYGVSKDYEKGVKWFALAANKGYIKSCQSLSVCYTCGYGVEVDIAEAKKWCKMAAEAGYSEAQYDMGVWAEKEGDHKEAMKWFKLAGENGSVKACRRLVDIYKTARGSDINTPDAITWCGKLIDLDPTAELPSFFSFFLSREPNILKSMYLKASKHDKMQAKILKLEKELDMFKKLAYVLDDDSVMTVAI